MANGPVSQRSLCEARLPMPPAGRAGRRPISTDGVLGRRLFAYLVDLIMIGLLALVLRSSSSSRRLLTLGLGWALFADPALHGHPLQRAHVGGPKQSTDRHAPDGRARVGRGQRRPGRPPPRGRARAPVLRRRWHLRALGGRRACRRWRARPAARPRPPGRARLRAQPERACGASPRPQALETAERSATLRRCRLSGRGPPERRA